VAVAGRRSNEVVTEDQSIDWDRSDYDPYARTKKFCEHMMRVLLPDTPKTVFRPSIVLGDSRYPETTQFEMVKAFVFLAGLPVLPFRPSDKIDIVNVDFVADAIATLHQKDQPRYDTYHLSSGMDSQTFRQLTAALAAVMGEYEKGLAAVGVHLERDQWYGPGQAAQAWMDNIALTKREVLEATISDEVFEFARRAYYGGRFEVFAHGHIPGTAYEYDINSAYPQAMSVLPEWGACEWEWINGQPQGGGSLPCIRDERVGRLLGVEWIEGQGWIRSVLPQGQQPSGSPVGVPVLQGADPRGSGHRPPVLQPDVCEPGALGGRDRQREHPADGGTPWMTSDGNPALVGSTSEVHSVGATPTLALLDCTTFGTDPIATGLPHREKSGRILYPRQTRGVRWSFELEAAIAAVSAIVCYRNRCLCIAAIVVGASERAARPSR